MGDAPSSAHLAHASDMSQASLGPRRTGELPTMASAAGPRTDARRTSLWQSVRDMLMARDSSKMDVADAVVAMEVIRSDRSGKVDKTSFWSNLFRGKGKLIHVCEDRVGPQGDFAVATLGRVCYGARVIGCHQMREPGARGQRDAQG